MGDRLVLWDFDGTLAWRPGLWSGCTLEVLDDLQPGHDIAIEQLREALRKGFPWHTPDDPHLHLCEPDAWWTVVEGLIASALFGAGVPDDRARHLASAVRQRYIDGSVGWRLYDDTLPALSAVEKGGWRNAVLSNHVPELPQLVGTLGIHVDAVFTSALTGFEKPHPDAFGRALKAFEHPRSVWVVGDSLRCDIQGAEALGLPAIHVRRDGHGCRSVPGLAEAAAVILAS